MRTKEEQLRQLGQEEAPAREEKHQRVLQGIHGLNRVTVQLRRLRHRISKLDQEEVEQKEQKEHVGMCVSLMGLLDHAPGELNTFIGESIDLITEIEEQLF